jgi:hypothetical protein
MLFGLGWLGMGYSVGFCVFSFIILVHICLFIVFIKIYTRGLKSLIDLNRQMYTVWLVGVSGTHSFLESW